jgi:hypothetical protein
MPDSVAKPDLTQFVEYDLDTQHTAELLHIAIDKALDMRAESRAKHRPSDEDAAELAARAQELRVLDATDRERARREAKRRLDREERGAVQVPEILTLRERLARPASPTTYRIDGALPAGGRVVWSGPFKGGKTTRAGKPQGATT